MFILPALGIINILFLLLSIFSPSYKSNTSIFVTSLPPDFLIWFNISKDDEKISFDKSKRQIVNQVRGLNCFPGAFCLLDGNVLKVFSCRRGDGIYNNALPGEIVSIYDDGFGVCVSNGEVVFTEVQPAGKRKMSARDFINGYKGVLKGKILR